MRRLNKVQVIKKIKRGNYKIKVISYYCNLNKNTLAYYSYIFNKRAQHLAKLLNIDKIVKYLIRLKKARL